MTANTITVHCVSTREVALWVALTMAAALPQGAGAATKTFDGGTNGTATTLDTAANWVGDIVPATGDEVLLDNSAITLPATLTTLTTATFGNLIVNSTTLNLIQVTSGTVAKNITLSGGGGSAAAIAAGGATGDLLLLGSAVHSTVTIGGGSGTGKLNTPLGGDGNFDVVNSDATLAVIGVVSGAFSLNKTGAGTLTLSGANTFGGAGSRTFALKTGTLNINSTNALGGAATTFRIDDGTTINNTSGGAITLANNQPVSINGSFTFTGGSGVTHDLNLGTGIVNLGSATRTITTSAGKLTLGGAITNSGSLIKAGAGTLTLSTTNTFSGTTTISNGKIVLGSALALQNSAYDTTGSTGSIGLDVTGLAALTLGGLAGSVNLVTAITGYGGVSGLTLNPQVGVTVTYGGVIADGSGIITLTKTGAGTQVFSGTNSYSGGTTIGAGVLSVAGTYALPGWDTNGCYAVASNATLAVGNAVTDANVATILGTTNFAAGASIGFDTTAGNRTNSINVVDTTRGALGLIKLGANTLTLAGSNTYSGVTAVGNGTLQIGDGTVNGSIACTSIVNNASVTYDVAATTTNTYAGVISGSGSVTKNGSGTLTLSGANTWTGTTTINGGVLLLQAPGNYGYAGGTIFVNGLSKLRSEGVNFIFTGKTVVFDAVGGGTFETGNSNFRGGLDVFITSGGAQDFITGGAWNMLGQYDFSVSRGSGATSDLTVSTRLIGVGPLVKTGTGILTLSATNTFTGGTVLSGGICNIAAASALGATNSPLTFDGGTLQFGGAGITIGSRSVVITANGGCVDTSLHDGTLASNISGVGGLTKIGAGTLTFSGTNTYSGLTIVSNGLLRLTQSQCLGTNTAVYLCSGATNDLAFTGTIVIDSLYIDGVVVSAGTWGSTLSPAQHQNNTHFTGTGVLAPVNGVAPRRGTLISVK